MNPKRLGIKINILNDLFVTVRLTSRGFHAWIWPLKEQRNGILKDLRIEFQKTLFKTRKIWMRRGICVEFWQELILKGNKRKCI